MTAADAFAWKEALRPLVIARGVASPQPFDRVLAAAPVELDQRGRHCVRSFYLADGRTPPPGPLPFEERGS